MASLPRTHGAGVITDNDREIFRLIAEGYSTSEVAAQLNYSHQAISKRLGKLRDDLALPTLEALYMYVGQQGLVQVGGKQ